MIERSVDMGREIVGPQNTIRQSLWHKENLTPLFFVKKWYRQFFLGARRDAALQFRIALAQLEDVSAGAPNTVLCCS